MSEINKLIKQMALDAFKSAAPSDLMLGEVVSPMPNLEIRLKNNPKMVIPKEMLVVNRDLLKYKRTVDIRMHPTKNTKITISSNNVGESMTPAGYQTHTHDITNITLNNVTIDIKDAEIEFTDELKVGDIVLVESFSGGQMFYVSAIVVTFE